jgi:radical SAM superfamily enzyme YgiQ (UPF0313 family)
MRVAIISVFVDYHRRGAHHRGVLQPQVGPLIAALLPDSAEVDIVNDTWVDPDWSRDYDLVFLSCMHAEFDRARQIAHYWRKRGAQVVIGGSLASLYPHLCAPWFDAVVVGDPEDTVPHVYADAQRHQLQRLYRSGGDASARAPTPHVHKVAHQQIFPLALEVTRGCPYTCDFCVLTGMGTRFDTRPTARVEADLLTLRDALKGRVTGPLKGKRRRMAMFYDNNIAGNLAYLRQLCDLTERLGLEWASSVTFNVLTNRALLQRMFDSGCRALYVGLETFNPAALDDFNKPQNRLPLIRRALDDARDVGILVTAGMILSPQHDDVAYIRSLPRRLRESGLHVPTFLAFETPFPGTPYFHRLARTNADKLARGEPALFLPNALLRDFTSYTLVVEPTLATATDYVAAYRDTLDEIYAPRRRLAKLAHDVPSFLKRRAWTSALLDVGDMLMAGLPRAPGRTWLAGTDLAPPEQVPLTDADFDDEAQARRLREPTAVTDAQGRLLPQWAPLDESLHAVAPPRTKKKSVAVP